MLAQSWCSKRGCIHYLGVKQDQESEMGERNICKAYPDGIPDEIAYGEFPHDEVYPGQNGDFIFQSSLPSEF